MLRPETIQLPEENIDGTFFVNNGYRKKKKNTHTNNKRCQGYGKTGTSCTIGRNVNGAATVETVQRFLRTLKMEPPYNSAVIYIPWIYI